eukprot:m.120435 g.120435  ORF g.120435 m.120435 type:complete len:56 (+) comp23234_c0_seq3:65-232(+)
MISNAQFCPMVFFFPLQFFIAFVIPDVPNDVKEAELRRKHVVADRFFNQDDASVV